MTFPASGDFDVPATTADLTQEEFAALQEQFLAATKLLPGGTSAHNVSIASGVIVPTSPFVRLITEGGTPTDTLTRIDPTNFQEGSIIYVRPLNPGYTITVENNQTLAGGIQLADQEDYLLTSSFSGVALIYTEGSWKELAVRSYGTVIDTKGKQFFTASGTFTVPVGVEKIWMTVVGGGGGGGGGTGGSEAPAILGSAGTAGSAGVDTVVGTLTGSGGSGGGYGGTSRGGSPGVIGGSFGERGVAGIAGDLGGYGGLRGTLPYGTNYGWGGTGGAGGSGAYASGGGGAGGNSGVVQQKIEQAVSPGESITVTIGAGGAGGALGAGGGTGTDGTAGTVGQSGFALIEW